MRAKLDERVSQLIGEGNNRVVSFGVEMHEDEPVPLVAVVRNDLSLVEIPLTRSEGEAGEEYMRQIGKERIVVSPLSRYVQVLDEQGRVLAQQQYV